MIGYIYEIRNLTNNKSYIGSTINLNSRKNNHFNMLKSGHHHSSYLQNSYNKHGLENFQFKKIETVEVFDRDELFKIEFDYIEKWKLSDNKFGYNMSMPTISGGSINERLYRAVVGINFSGDMVDKFISISEAARALDISTSRICNSIKLYNGRYKNIRFIYEEDYNLNKDYSFKPYNKKAKRSGKPISKYSIDGDFIQTYGKLEDAAKDCKVDMSSISGALTGRQMVSAGFRWAYEGDELAIVDRNKVTRNNSYMKKCILQMDLDGNIINKFKPKDLPSEFKIKGVRKCIYGETTKYKGFKWEYKN